MSVTQRTSNENPLASEAFTADQVERLKLQQLWVPQKQVRSRHSMFIGATQSMESLARRRRTCINPSNQGSCFIYSLGLDGELNLDIVKRTGAWTRDSTRSERSLPTTSHRPTLPIFLTNTFQRRHPSRAGFRGGRPGRSPGAPDSQGRLAFRLMSEVCVGGTSFFKIGNGCW